MRSNHAGVRGAAEFGNADISFQNSWNERVDDVNFQIHRPGTSALFPGVLRQTIGTACWFSPTNAPPHLF